jgi:hypothetical protein
VTDQSWVASKPPVSDVTFIPSDDAAMHAAEVEAAIISTTPRSGVIDITSQASDSNFSITAPAFAGPVDDIDTGASVDNVIINEWDRLPRCMRR